MQLGPMVVAMKQEFDSILVRRFEHLARIVGQCEMSIPLKRSGIARGHRVHYQKVMVKEGDPAPRYLTAFLMVFEQVIRQCPDLVVAHKSQAWIAPAFYTG